MNIDLAGVHARLAGRYTVERELGRGGMGAVYLARDVRLDRPVALKVLPAELAANTTLRDRFLRETRTAASFSHPNIVPVYAVEESPDLLAYSMAYVEGESLAARVKRVGPLGVRETVKLLQDVGYALAYAHGRGVVHRDIKPDNIMLERATGRALVLDFGISRAIAAAPTGQEGLTRVGEVVGTPEYMSPEQATGDHVDGRSDLYSLGLTAYFALTGKPAITGDTTGKVLARQITEAVAPIKTVRVDAPDALAQAVDRCVAKDPAERFETAEALVEALDAARLAGPEIPLPIRTLAQEMSSLSLTLIFGAAVTWFMVRSRPEDTANDDILLPVVVLVSVLVTRVTQTMREVGRIAAVGFSAADIMEGLRAVLGERDQRRSDLKAHEPTRRARRKTLVGATVQLAMAVVMAFAALQFRHPRPGGGHNIGLPGTVLIFSAMVLLGVSLALFLRSPFRRPMGERFFRLIWLGPIGRGFVRRSGRTVWRGGKADGAKFTPARVTGAPAPARSTAPAVVAPTQSIASLEARVAELERWRDTTSSV